MRGQGATLGKRARQCLREQQAFFANEEGGLVEAATPCADSANGVDGGGGVDGVGLAPQAGQLRSGQGMARGEGRGAGQQRGLNKRRRDGSCLNEA